MDYIYFLFDWEWEARDKCSSILLAGIIHFRIWVGKWKININIEGFSASCLLGEIFLLYLIRIRFLTVSDISDSTLAWGLWIRYASTWCECFPKMDGLIQYYQFHSVEEISKHPLIKSPSIDDEESVRALITPVNLPSKVKSNLTLMLMVICFWFASYGFYIQHSTRVSGGV